MKIKIKIAMLATAFSLLLQGCATPQLNRSPDVLFKEGEQHFLEGDYEDAIVQWKRVKESYQSPELTTRAEMGIADAYFLNKDYIEAAAAYEDFRKLHPRHEKAGYALYRQALSYYHQIHRIDTDQAPVKNAVSFLGSYLRLYPGGEHTSDASAKLLECRDKQLQYEIYVAKFYLNDDKYPAVIARFEQALKSFDDLPRRDEVLFHLGKTYLQTGQKSQGREVLDRLLKEFPASPYASDAEKAMNKYL